MTDVNASGWDAPAAIVFTNTDTTTLRDMDLFLRYDDRMEEDTLTVEKTERGVHVQMRITTTGDENVFFDQTIS